MQDRFKVTVRFKMMSIQWVYSVIILIRIGRKGLRYFQKFFSEFLKFFRTVFDGLLNTVFINLEESSVFSIQDLCTMALRLFRLKRFTGDWEQGLRYIAEIGLPSCQINNIIVNFI